MGRERDPVGHAVSARRFLFCRSRHLLLCPLCFQLCRPLQIHIVWLFSISGLPLLLNRSCTVCLCPFFLCAPLFVIAERWLQAVLFCVYPHLFHDERQFAEIDRADAFQIWYAASLHIYFLEERRCPSAHLPGLRSPASDTADTWHCALSESGLHYSPVPPLLSIPSHQKNGSGYPG